MKYKIFACHSSKRNLYIVARLLVARRGGVPVSTWMEKPELQAEAPLAS